ncbi:hypothetical protein CO058_01580 [candidate division WWE3 bacterium CG_4_9_14_0_2_um_filter_35_11]|uniref:Uncharacterized protein n=1 Tax=candidate division WWE3 bacterium CG_4_9_14_0_2_um_filter_35_11 TaxID=1975077 RepID=A0A2M8EM17_UNCKA|nr:MAG: hypothetical protein COV25_04100 [candidate division WWE3 bacterium CG10_big_fil_rev_8_21_14_0_10_35_32]PJC23783.1 MAG: hypothetical protein CO058_01580 [candidate division WWE3 bacterium CG_4_9_14_0_2_um_filter_35_11]
MCIFLSKTSFSDLIEEMDKFVILAKAPKTPDGHTSLWQFFRDVGDNSEVASCIKESGKIELKEFEDPYQASREYQIND